MKTLLLIFSSFLLSSCMHFIPMDQEGTRTSSEDQVLEKDITVGDVRAVAIFPPLQSGKDVQFTLKLFHSGTMNHLSGAKVFGHFDHVHKPDHMSMTHVQHDSLAAYRMETEHAVSHQIG